MAEKVISQIQFEIGQIDVLFESYADLLKHMEKSVPNLVELTAIASVLHSFYNGLENIFLVIAKGIDTNVPTSAQWHRELLSQMIAASEKRSAVLSAETFNLLKEYLGFRHFFRHSYSFFMEWDELEKLVKPVEGVWTKTKTELQLFMDSLTTDKAKSE